MSSTSLNPACSLLVVIVNYRTAHLVIDCLHSLVQEVRSLPSVRVAIVDNDSQDGSVAKLGAAIASEGWGGWATLIPSQHNGGYASGNNLAIRPALAAPNPPDYVLLLNPDTQVRPGALKTLLEYMEQHPQIGIAGSGIEEPDGTLWPIAFRFPSVLSELDAGLQLGFISKLLSRWVVAQPMGSSPQEIDWVPGASMIIRRQVFETVGLMDEDYFLYYEETDFCLQAKRAGWPCWYVPQSRIMHISGQSTGVTGKQDVPKRLPQYVFDSRRRYFVKNHGRLYAMLADLAWTSGFIVWQVRRRIQRKPDDHPPAMLQDFLRNSVLFRFSI